MPFMALELESNPIGEVSAQMVCLNDSQTIRKSVESLLRCGVKKIVVVDGGSSDGTLEQLSDLQVILMTSRPGIRAQTLLANEQMNSLFTFVGEADQLYEDFFVVNLLEELTKFGMDGIQARKIYKNPKSFWEQGEQLFFEIHQPPPGPTQFISGPQIWYTESWKRVVAATQGNEGYSFDTELADAIATSGLAVGIGMTETEEIGPVSFKDFLRRVRNYGFGDDVYYRSNSGRWALRRKIQSITHVFRKYGVIYPLKALVYKRSIIGPAYFWLICGFRYFFWIRAALLRPFIS
jgi:glycosyltransferase involved in cell wall biosynthesis